MIERRGLGGVEIEFPFEFVVEGAARSLQASPDSLGAWRERIRAAAQPGLPDGHWANTDFLHVTIYYFPDTEMDGDIDNIVKPILDAMEKFIYINDRQVDRIVVQRFEPGRFASFSQPSAVLVLAAEMIGPRVYIRIDVPKDLEIRDE